MKSSENKRTPVVLCAKRFRLETLLAFWLIAVALPIMAIHFLSIFSYDERQQVRDLQKMNRMFDTMVQLQQRSLPLNFFTRQISQAETASGFPDRSDLKLSITDKQFSSSGEQLKSEFARNPSFHNILLLSATKDLKTLQIHHDNSAFADFPRPGRRAAKTVLKELTRIHQPATARKKIMAPGNERMLKNFIESIFGSYFNPLKFEEDFSTGFNSSGQGQRIYIARRLFYDADGELQFAYLALFIEKKNLLQKSFASAIEKLPAEFAYSCSMKVSRPLNFFEETPDATQHIHFPVPFALLNSGNFSSSSIVQKLLKSGIMQKRPAVYPHFSITAASEKTIQNSAKKSISLGFFIIICFSLILMRKFHKEGSFRIKIRYQLLLAIFCATALPISIFVFFIHRYSDQRDQMKILELKNFMRNRLVMLEFSIKTQDESLNNRIFQTAAELHKNIGNSKSVLKDILNKGIDKTFVGGSLNRNDGTIVEIVDVTRLKANFAKDKLKFHKQIVQGNIVRIFIELGLIRDSYLQKLRLTATGKKTLAIARMLDPLDVDTYCSYEGIAHSSKEDFGTFRFLTFKLLPQFNHPEENAGLLMLIQDLRSLAHGIVKEYSHNWEMFHEKNSQGAIETSIISTLDLRASKLDYNNVWPGNLSLSESQEAVLRTITTGQSEAISEIYDSGGNLEIVVGKRLGRYPLIAVSRCQMLSMSSNAQLISLFSATNSIYLLILLFILSSVMNELFANPIHALVQANAYIANGERVEIKNSFNNELSRLTTKVEDMSIKLIERERLTRFVSQEAVATISAESRDLKTIKPARVLRTMVFIHIKDFAEIDKSLSAEKLIALLNLYFPFFETFIDQNNGQVDKCMADAIMAVFSDSADSSCAFNACKALSDAKNELQKLNNSLSKADLPEINISAGIATGQVISGRIGSYEGRLDYTVIGDKVNLAARLETAASSSSVHSAIFIDGNTLVGFGASFSASSRGKINVKGKSEAVEVYELNG